MNKIILLIGISLLFTTGLFAQSTCCLQIITSKTNNPFNCVKTKQDSIILYNGQTLYNGVPLTFKSLTLSNETWGYKGLMIKTLSISAMGEPAFIPGYIFVIDDACNVVCKTTIYLNYNPQGNPVMSYQIGGTDCNPAIVKLSNNTLSIDAIKINY